MESRRTASGFRVADDALGLVGATPLVRLGRVSPSDAGTVWAKVEFSNPAGSVKDRPAMAMILEAERTKKLASGSTIVEATSGNTGISLAMIAAVRGYRCVLVMPEDMSLERRYVLRAYGAEIVLTQALDGMSGAVAKALEILEETPGAFMPSQFDNPENPGSHERTTAQEILEQTDRRSRRSSRASAREARSRGSGAFSRKRSPASESWQWSPTPARSSVASPQGCMASRVLVPASFRRSSIER